MFLRKCAAAIDSLSEDLGIEMQSGVGLEDRLKAIIKDNPEILTAGVAFNPSIVGHLHAPAATRQGSDIKMLQLQDHHDYSAPDVTWYNEGVRAGNGWRIPIWSETEESMTVTYSAPFYNDAEDPSTIAGVAFLLLSLDRIREVGDGLVFQ
jgi:hypothetical protein